MTIIHLEDGVPPAKSRLVRVGGVQTGNIAAGNYETYDFTPPKGKLWEVIFGYLYVKKPNGAASGTHTFAVMLKDLQVMSGKSVFGSSIEWNSSMWVVADSAQQPSTEGGAQSALYHLVSDHNNHIRIDYYNDTNVSQTWARYIYLYVKETPII